MEKSFIRLVREARYALNELEERANQIRSEFRHRIAVSNDGIKSIEDTYYEVLRLDTEDDQPFKPVVLENNNA